MKTNKMVAVAMVAVLMLAATSVALYEMDDDAPDDSEAFIPIIAAFAVGFAVGYLVNMYTDIGDPGTPDLQEEINAVMRQGEAEKVAMAGEAARAFAGTILPADISLWGHTQQHWNRSAEMVVTGTWMFGTSYDPNYTIEQAQHRKNIEAYIYDWQAAFDNLYNYTLISHMAKWASKSHLTAMTYDLVWNGGSAPLAGSTMDWLQIVQNVNANATVYIDADTHVTGGTYQQDTSGTLYKLSDGTVKLRSMVTGKVITLTDLETNLATKTYDGLTETVKSGLYRIETAGATLAGAITQAADAAAAPVNGAMLFTSAGSDPTWFMANDNGQTVVKTKTTSSTTTRLSIDVGFVDRDGNTATESTFIVTPAHSYGGKAVSAANLIVEWDQLIDKMNYTIDKAAQAGQVLWDIFDVCEETIPFLAPSSMTTTVEGVNLNAVQAKQIALSSMQQISAAYTQHGGALDAQLKQTFNAESLDLYIQGDIYYNGHLYAADAVFTPYSALQAQTFVAGETTVWQNAGYAMVWGSGDIDGWAGPANTTSYELLSLGEGYTIMVTAIGSSGALRDSAKITPTEIKKYSVDPTETADPEEAPQVEVGKMLMMLAIGIAGGLCIGFGMRGPYFLILVGIVLLVIVGLMYAPPSFLRWPG